MNCKSCGKEFELKGKRYPYCSEKCRKEYGKFSANCSFCGREIMKHRYQESRSKNFFCDIACKGKWHTENITGENGYNWRGGSWNNRVQLLAHTSYRTWRAGLLNGAVCILCGTDEKLELHHIVSKAARPDLIKDEQNVVPICAKEHDIFHSNSCKGGELRGLLNDILSHGNPQPSLPNVLLYVGRKVQRLMGEDIQSDKPDTSAAPERDDIVRAYSERVRG